MSLKKLQKKVDKTNRKKPRFQIIAATNDEKTVWLMFSCCAFISKVKLNKDWQIEIISKSICVVNRIACIATLYWIDNFRLYKKYLCLPAKKVGFFTENIFLRELELRLEEIWTNRDLSKLGQLLTKTRMNFSRLCSGLYKK